VLLVTCYWLLVSGCGPGGPSEFVGSASADGVVPIIEDGSVKADRTRASLTIRDPDERGPTSNQ